MKTKKSKNMYRALSFLSRRGRHANGVKKSELSQKFNSDIISELVYYGYLAEIGSLSVRLTVKGYEALKVHILTVTNVVTAIVAAAVAVLALFL